jgi:hypothetical protein
MARLALFVSTSTYADDQLAQLPSAASDAVELGGLFADPRVGPFTVETMESPSAQEMRLALEDLFADATADDLVLLYLSGHGLKDLQGNLYFAAHDTRPNRLQSTAVSAQLLCTLLNSSRAEGAVVFLDCCYGGAFARGMVARAAGDPQVGDAFASLGAGARARAVITASSAIEYAFEGERLTDTHVQPSVFASAMRDGITDGQADRDGDGWVGLNELFDHIRQQIIRAGHPQTPHLWTFGASGDLHIARNPRGARAQVTILPAEIRELLGSPVPAARLGAATDLRHRAASDDLPMARAAVAALVELLVDDSLRVRASAELGLSGAQPRITPTHLSALPGATVRATLTGSAVGLEAFVDSAPDGVTASVDGGELIVAVGEDVAAGELEIQLRWAGGNVPVPLAVEALPAVPEPPAAEPAPDEAEEPEIRAEPAELRPAPPTEETSAEPVPAAAPAPERKRPDRPVWLLAAALLWLVALFLPVERSGGSFGEGSSTFELSPDILLSELAGFIIVLAFLVGILAVAVAVIRWRPGRLQVAGAIVGGLAVVLLALMGGTVGTLLDSGDFYLAGVAITLASACAVVYLADASVRAVRVRKAT